MPYILCILHNFYKQPFIMKRHLIILLLGFFGGPIKILRCCRVSFVWQGNGEYGKPLRALAGFIKAGLPQTGMEFKQELRRIGNKVLF